jgi:hypothetical protein
MVLTQHKKWEPPNTGPNPIQIPSTVSLCVWERESDDAAHMPCPDSDIRFDTKKNLVNKNQGWEPIQQKYKAKENTSRHNLKEKPKKNNQQKSG